MGPTFGSIKPRAARYVGNGVCNDDDRVMDRVNLAVERLLTRGKFKGLLVRYLFCAFQNCFTLPTEIETILKVSVEGDPYQVRNGWFEYLDNGPGRIASDSETYRGLIIDRGLHPSHYDVCDSKYIRVYTSLPEDADAEIQLFGIDDNNLTIQTLDGSEYIEGEMVGIDNGTPQTSAKLFTRLTRVKKPVTNGFVTLYQVDPSSGAQSAIARYAPGETDPSFRRYFLPGVAGETDGKVCLSVIAKRRYLPITSDSDTVLISNFNALKLMLQALHREDSNLMKEADIFEEKAVRILKDELAEYLGDTSTGNVEVQMPQFGASGIPNLV